jgi:hypothetical protein
MTNRKRGRPVGTHICDDRPLAMVADRIAADPELRPSTAMRQVYAAGTWRGTEKTVVTRWLRKWKASGAAACLPPHVVFPLGILFLTIAADIAKPRSTLSTAKPLIRGFSGALGHTLPWRSRGNIANQSRRF